MTKPSISVVFPAYNEEENIRATMARALASLSRQFETFEIIIVNDASTDSTGQIAEQLAQNDNHFLVIHNDRNMRLGATLLRGLGRARYDLITFDAMDYPFDLDDLAEMVPLLATNDVVVAVRKQRAGYTVFRKIISHVNLALLHLFFELKLRDYNFVQVYKRRVLETIPVVSRSTGFVTSEMLLRAHRSGFTIAEVDIKYLPREHGIARSGSPAVIMASVRDLMLFWLRTNRLMSLMCSQPKENIPAVVTQASGHNE
jgi:glycosyltransferase involved in cell wall biosynthesis